MSEYTQIFKIFLNVCGFSMSSQKFSLRLEGLYYDISVDLFLLFFVVSDFAWKNHPKIKDYAV